MGGLKQKCPPRGYGYFLELHIKVLQVNALRKAIRELLLKIENYVSATISTSTITDKSLGTVVQFERSLIYTKFISARYLHCTSPPPPPTPLTVLKPSRQNFFDLSTLYWVGKGEGLWIFYMKALLFRTVLVIHVELLLCSYFNKDFCPGL